MSDDRDILDRSGAPPDEPERYELTELRRYSFDLDRRGFLGTLGSGLLVVVARRELAAQQESGTAAARPATADEDEIGAWVHIGADGVTAFTGKTEIGQNIRTSLAQTIADELRVPVASVTMVMADTDRTPFDRGTYGSQTTPRMAPQLARAAATARERLIDLAAAAWGVDRTTLKARDGRVVAPDGRSASYADLTRNRLLTGKVDATAAVDPPARWQHRGTAVPKVNAREIVTGAHRYTPDLARPGLLHGRIVRPDGYRATLVSLDDSHARAMDGVTVVRDGDFIGVVAPRERVAARAAQAVDAVWRVPSGGPTSDTVYEHLKSSAAEADPVHTAGDVKSALASAARRMSASFRIPYIAHVPLEPRAAVAEWQDGRLTVWVGTQRPFGVRSELARAFHIPEERVRVIVPDTGSAYGGKHTGEHAIEAARLARAANRPVKLVWTREDEFAWGYFRPAGVIDVECGIDGDGRLVAWSFDNWNSGAAAIRTPYAVPHQRIVFHRSDSPLRQGSYRALAATANHFAREMQMDAIARELRIDAVEFRLKHLENERLRAVLQAAADKAGWPGPKGRDRSLGIACGTEKGSYVATAATLAAERDGFRVERLVVAFECGAIVNPDGLRAQVEGAVVQGLGGALFEAIEFADNRLVNGRLSQYRVPRFRDVPAIDLVLLDRRDLPSAGAGETPIVCVAPAIGSAARAFGEVAPAIPVRLEPRATAQGSTRQAVGSGRRAGGSGQN